MATPARKRKPEVKGDMNLVKLVERFGSEDKCRAYLERLRWPNGVRCPRCDSDRISRIVKRNQFDCDSCRYQFSVTAGTLFHDSHLPLWKWFLAIYLMVESKKSMSANQLKRTLGVSYKTAWYLCHRIRDAMGGDEQPLLDGIVEVDETLVGGQRAGFGSGYRGNKATVVGAVERGGEIRLRVVPNNRREHLYGFMRENISPDAQAIYTDELRSYATIPSEFGVPHETVQHKEEEWVCGEVHTQTVESAWSLFKRALVGSYHQVSVKHLPAYLDEIEFRFNGRENPFLFRDTLLVLLSGDALPYKELVARKRVGDDPQARDAEMRRTATRLNRMRNQAQK